MLSEQPANSLNTVVRPPSMADVLKGLGSVKLKSIKRYACCRECKLSVNSHFLATWCLCVCVYGGGGCHDAREKIWETVTFGLTVSKIFSSTAQQQF